MTDEPKEAVLSAVEELLLELSEKILRMEEEAVRDVDEIRTRAEGAEQERIKRLRRETSDLYKYKNALLNQMGKIAGMIPIAPDFIPQDSD